MLNREPTAIIGALSEAIRQIIPALIVFGFIQWSGEKTAAFNIMVGVVVGFLNVLLTRSQTVSVPQADALIQTAVNMPSGTPVEVVKTIQAEKDAK